MGTHFFYKETSGTHIPQEKHDSWSEGEHLRRCGCRIKMDFWITRFKDQSNFDDAGFMSTFWQSPSQVELERFFDFIVKPSLTYTPWNWQFAPENRPSPNETSIPDIHFQVRAVSSREGKFQLNLIKLKQMIGTSW